MKKLKLNKKNNVRLNNVGVLTDNVDQLVVNDSIAPIGLNKHKVCLNEGLVHGDLTVRGELKGAKLGNSLDVNGNDILNAGDIQGTSLGGTTLTHASIYAGTILAYRMIGEDAGHSTEVLTTSFAVVDASMVVRFEAPPSGAVEIMVQIHANAITSNRILYLGLSDNAVYNSIGNTYEQIHRMPDETDDAVVQHFWTVTGLSSGNTYSYWLGAKASATNSYLNWGGTSSTRYCDFIMKVTALPKQATHYAEYD